MLRILRISINVFVQLIGIEIFILLGRPSLLSGWLDVLRCGSRHGQSKQDKDDALLVNNRKPSYIAPSTDKFSHELGNDLEKGFFDSPRVSQPHPYNAAIPLLPTPAAEDINPFDISLPPTPLPKDASKAETSAVAQEPKDYEAETPGATETPEIAGLSDGLRNSSTNRRSRFLEARFSQEEPGPLNLDGQASQELAHVLYSPGDSQETPSHSPRPASSPSPAVPGMMVRMPNDSQRSRPLSGLWRSVSKGRREAVVDMKAGRGGLALNPVVKDEAELGK